MFQKYRILCNFVQNFPFLPLFWLFLTQIKAFLPQVKKYRPTEMVGIPTNGRYTDLSGSPGPEAGGGLVGDQGPCGGLGAGGGGGALRPQPSSHRWPASPCRHPATLAAGTSETPETSEAIIGLFYHEFDVGL